MHAATLFAAHRGRAARSVGAGLGAATRACQHRAGSADVIAHDRVAFFAVTGRRLASATITLACWVTLPTMALPPSATDTFCTVMAGSFLLRQRSSASIWAGNVRASRP